MGTFCPAPFMHQSMKVDGAIKACCRSLPRITTIRKTTLEEAWNHPELRQIRIDMLENVENNRCKICYDQEKVGVKSLRNILNTDKQKLEDANHALNHMNDDGTVNVLPTWIELKLSNLCNLKCRMCGPVDSTQWFSDYKSVKHLYAEHHQDFIKNQGVESTPLIDALDQNFYQKLDRLLSNVNRISFAGGEPLFDDNHYQVLKSVLQRAHEITLSYSTNLTVLNTKKHDVFKFWKKFKQILVIISVDGYPELNNYIRTNSHRYDIEKNIRMIQAHSNIHVAVKPTFQALNIMYLPEIIEWALSQGINDVGYHFVNTPDFMDCRIWTGEARDEIVEKLTSYMKNCTSDKAKSLTRNVLKYFKGNDLHTEIRWNNFIEFNKILDQKRNQSITDFEFLRRYMS